MKAWFLSDIHLKSVNERNGVILLRFLRSLLQDKETTHLFLLGDIFDIWIGSSSYFVDQFATLIELLDQLKEQGVQITFFEGNHDFHLDGFWEQEFGAEVYHEPHYFKIDSLRVRCEHGDFINTKDKAYLRYRRFMRSSLMRKAAVSLPGLVIEEIGQLASRKSRSVSSRTTEGHEEKLRQMIRDYTKNSYFKDDHFDILIAGHVHVRDEVKIDCEGQKVLSVNLGSWLEQPSAYCLDKGTGRFVELS